MYNSNYECRYHKDDVFCESDQATDDVKDYIRHILYQEDYLNIFSMESDAEFQCKIYDELYEKIKGSNELLNIISKAAATLLSEDPIVGLCVLYSYDYMMITHDCVSEYLLTDSISHDNVERMSKMLKPKR